MKDLVDLLNENMSILDVFGSIFLLFLAIGCLAMGAFLSYFGTGARQKWGGGLLGIGVLLVVLIVWFLGLLPFGSPVNWSAGPFLVGLVAGLAMIAGIGASAGAFLLIVIKKK